MKNDLFQKEKFTFQYKAEPMAMIVSFEKKIKKMDTLELAKLYNQKCFGLYDHIENLKEEIEQYKHIIVQLQSKCNSTAETANDNQEKVIENIKKALTAEFTHKEFTYEETIELLNKEIASLREENLSLKANLTKIDNDAKQNRETIRQIRRVKTIEKKETTEAQEQLSQVLQENLFLMYLLDRSLNFEKIIRKINSNFDFYFDLFVCDKKDINIYSSILYELLYRIHKKVDIESLSEEIYLSNSITKGEDYGIGYTQSEFLSSGLIDEDLLLKINQKVACYRSDSLEEISTLIKKCQLKVNTEPSFAVLKKFDVANVYTITSNGKLKIYCNKLMIDTVLFLVSTVRYCTEEIQIVELNGELKLLETMIETYIKVFYQLKINFKDKVKLLILNNITNLNEPFITNCLNKLIEYLPSLLKISINNCNLTTELLSKINTTTCKLIEIDLSNNKIDSLNYFHSNPPCESVILRKNPLLFRKGDGKIPFVRLDLSQNAFDVNAMNQFNNWMKESSVSSLNLSDVKIEQDTGILLGNTLEELKQLKCLTLNNIGLTEECAPLVLKHLNRTSIEELHLNDNNLGEIGSLIVTCLLESNSWLKRIELARCNIGPIAVKSLFSAIQKCELLTHINLEGNKFNKEDIAVLEGKKELII